MKPTAVIVSTGSANLASVISGLARVGVDALPSVDPERIRDARFVVLPGVGAFGPAARRLRATGIDQAIVERVNRGRSLLAICLGMQLLSEGSEEAEDAPGLGVFRGVVRRFAGPVRVPQIGWNRITPTAGASLLQGDAMYFANSYRLERVPDGWHGATCEHAGPFCAAVERGLLLACQFHPELSGAAGVSLLGRWVAAVQAAEEVKLTC